MSGCLCYSFFAMKRHVQLIELASNKKTFDKEAEVHAVGKAGLEIIMENPEAAGREIWKIFEDSALIDSLYENSIRMIIRKDHPLRMLIRTEFGDMEMEADLIRYECIHQNHQTRAILEYSIPESDEIIGFELKIL